MRRYIILGLCWLCTAAWGAEDVITRLADLRALPPKTAARGLRVRVEGVILGLEPGNKPHFFLHDGNSGCHVKALEAQAIPPLAPGTRVRVSGISNPLGYFPSIKDAEVTILGTGPLPQPQTPAAGALFSPQLDSSWVEVPATITDIDSSEDRFTLNVEVYGLPFKAELPLSNDANTRGVALMQRPVRLRGVMGTIFNRQSQMTDRHFFVPNFDFIQLTTDANPHAVKPLLLVSQLLTGNLGPDIAVQLKGRITQLCANGFYLRDDSGSTLIQTPELAELSPGMEVQVEGYGAVAPFRPILRSSKVTPLARTLNIDPIPLHPLKNDLSALHYERVSVDAEYLGSRSGTNATILQLSHQGRFFEAYLPLVLDNAPPLPSNGDAVRLVGICELTTTHPLPRMGWVDGFFIHLPAQKGIQILESAPWWTTPRLLGALGLMSSIAVVGILSTWTLRSQVRRQMSIISHKMRQETIREERDRMARELHDTLEQQLSGVALQLDGLDDMVQRNPTAAAASLSLARRMLRYTRREARRSVWDLRSKELEQTGLAAAVRAIATSQQHQNNNIRVEVHGQEHPLPTGVDFHLLRICQEAITNAIKHASAELIQVDFFYEKNRFHLRIRDNGCGFSTNNLHSSDAPHFGLMGMHERAAKINAEVQIHSQPGQGCSIEVTIPLHP